MHRSLQHYSEIPSVPLGEGSVDAVPIVVITLIVALFGGAVIYGLGRNRMFLLRLVAVIVFTLLVGAGLVLSLWIAYRPTNGWMPQ